MGAFLNCLLNVTLPSGHDVNLDRHGTLEMTAVVVPTLLILK